MGNLYNKINDLCEKRGISGYRMCKDTGLPPSMMTELKKGRQSSISIDKLKKIADYFNVPLEYFRDDYEEIKKEPAAASDELEKYIDMLRTRPEMRLLLDTQDGATKEQVEENVRFLDALRKAKNVD